MQGNTNGRFSKGKPHTRHKENHPMWGRHTTAWNKGVTMGPNPAHSEFMKGRVPWNKGIKTGPNPKHSEAMRGRPAWNRGIEMSEKFRETCRQRESNKLRKAAGE